MSYPRKKRRAARKDAENVLSEFKRKFNNTFGPVEYAPSYNDYIKSPDSREYLGTGGPGSKSGPAPQKVARQTTIHGKNEGGKRNPQRVEPQTTLTAKSTKNGEGNPFGSIMQSPDLPAGSDALAELAQSMLSDTASQSFDYESALQQSQRAIRRAYAAEINAIRSNNKAAKKETRKARRDIESMYKGLANAYGETSRDTTQRGEQNVQQSLDLANQANAQIKATQQSTTAEQAQMLKDLGLEATADQIITPDFSKVAETMAGVTAEGAENADTARQMASADAEYYKRGKKTARLEGSNRSADLIGELHDYLRGNRGQIASLKGQRGKEIATNRQNVQQSAAEAQAQADSELWDRVMQFTAMQQDMQQQQFENQLAANQFQYGQYDDRRDAKLDWKKAILQAKTSLAKSTSSGKSGSGFADALPPSMQAATVLFKQAREPSKVMNVLMSMAGRPEFVQGQVSQGNGQYTDLNAAAKMQIAAQVGKQAGLTNEDINLLKMAVMGIKEF